MKRNSSKVLCGSVAAVLGLLAGAAPAVAQLTLAQALLLRSNGITAASATPTTPAAPAATTEDALHALADQAAVIFTGEVLRVLPEAGAMRIDLQVDNGIRGVSSGDTYTVRQWAGLWTPGAAPFHLGQRALFLLHAPSVGGFSSPVGGTDGIIPLSGDSNTAAVDLRWIAAHVARSAAPRPDNAPDGIVPAPYTVYAASATPVVATAAHQARATTNGIAWPADPTNGNVLGTDLRGIDLNLVSGLLRSWNARITAGAAQ